MKKSIIVILLSVFLSCSTDKSPLSPSDVSSFSIYLLKYHSLNLQQIKDSGINDLILDDTAWICGDDIEFYDYSTHCIYLSKMKNEFFTKELSISMNDQPFVVKANNKRCYIGSFHSGAMSLAPTKPYIDEISTMFFPTDVLYINPGWDSIDERNNTNIETSLDNMNKLHYGIVVKIKNIQVVDNSDTASVLYTYELINHDKDNLYVLDPDKMGSDLFHYFTNGIDFRNDDEYFSSEYKFVKQPEPFDSWQPSWFTEIKTGEKLQRTVLLKGYPPIPVGTYNCDFTFSSPLKIEKNDRYIENGRIWIGKIESETINISVQ